MEWTAEELIAILRDSIADGTISLEDLRNFISQKTKAKTIAAAKGLISEIIKGNPPPHGGGL